MDLRRQDERSAAAAAEDAPAETRVAASPAFELIESAIEELRPYLRADGGDCELVAVEGNLVTVRLRGACVGCQLAAVTIGGVQQRLVKKLGRPLRIAVAPGPR